MSAFVTSMVLHPRAASGVDARTIRTASYRRLRRTWARCGQPARHTKKAPPVREAPSVARGWGRLAAAAEAVVAVDRPAAGGLEGDLGGAAAVGAHGVVHLARRAIVAAATIPAAAVPAAAVTAAAAAPIAAASASVAIGAVRRRASLRLAGLPTRLATLGRVAEALLGIEGLLGCGEGELLPAIQACDGLVLVHGLIEPPGSVTFQGRSIGIRDHGSVSWF